MASIMSSDNETQNYCKLISCHKKPPGSLLVAFNIGDIRHYANTRN